MNARHRQTRFLASVFVLAAENRLELRRARLVASLLLDPCRSTALEVRTKPPSATATEHSPEISPAPDRAAPTVDRWRAKLTAHPRRARTGPAPQNRTLAPEWMEVDDPSPGSSGRAATFGRAPQPSVRPLPRKRDQRCRPPTSNPVAPCGSCPLLTTAGPGVTIPLASARSPRPLDLHRPIASSPLPPLLPALAGQVLVVGSVEALPAARASLGACHARASASAARAHTLRMRQPVLSGREARTTHRPPTPTSPLQVTCTPPRSPPTCASRPAGPWAGWSTSSSRCPPCRRSACCRRSLRRARVSSRVTVVSTACVVRV